MNGYVAGGWGATAGMLALYTWRVLHRGRGLTRALPAEARAPEAQPAEPQPTEPASTEPPSTGGVSPGEHPGAGREVRTWR